MSSLAAAAGVFTSAYNWLLTPAGRRFLQFAGAYGAERLRNYLRVHQGDVSYQTFRRILDHILRGAPPLAGFGAYSGVGMPPASIFNTLKYIAGNNRQELQKIVKYLPSYDNRRNPTYTPARRSRQNRFSKPGVLPGSGPLSSQRPYQQSYALALSKISRPLMKLVERPQTKIINCRYELENLQLLASKMTGNSAIGFTYSFRQHSFSVPIMPTQSVNGGSRAVIAIKAITYKIFAPLIPYVELDVGSTSQGEIINTVIDDQADFVKRGAELLKNCREHSTYITGNDGNECPQGLSSYSKDVAADGSTDFASYACIQKYGSGFLNQSPYSIGPIFSYKNTHPLPAADDNIIRNMHNNWAAWVNKHSYLNTGTPNLYDGFRNWQHNLETLQEGMSTTIEKRHYFKDPVVYPGYSLRFGLLTQIMKPWYHAVAPPFLFGSLMPDLGPYIDATIEISIEYEERSMSQGEYIKLTQAYPNCLFQGPDVNCYRKE